MADVVALVLIAGAVLGHEFIYARNIAEGVAEDEGLAVLDVLFLPRKFPASYLGCHAVEGEIHRPHVERAHFRTESQRRGEPLLDRHLRAATGGEVDDGVRRLMDLGQELGKHVGVPGRRSILRVARMQMQDRSPRARGVDRLLGDIGRCIR